MQPTSPCLYPHSDIMQSQLETNGDEEKHCALVDGNVVNDANTSITMPVTVDRDLNEQIRVCHVCGLSLALSEYNPSTVASGGTTCKQCLHSKASRYALTDGRVRCPRDTLPAVQTRMQQVHGVNMPKWAMNKGILLGVLENCHYQSAISGIRRRLVLVQATHNPMPEGARVDEIAPQWMPNDSMCVTVTEAADIAIRRSMQFPLPPLADTWCKPLTARRHIAIRRRNHILYSCV
jgi:hypothetical protein